MYDLAIIGGGPAGVAAGVYAARKRLKTVLVAEAIGGQSIDSQDIQNWIGTPHIVGTELQKSLDKHVREYAADVLEPRLGERATNLEKKGENFVVTTPKGVYEARAVLVATGGVRRKLEVPGAAEFENKGVTYCASCDGLLFANQDVVVVGGGNAGFETAAQLLAYCRSVTLLSRSDFSRADALTVEAVSKHPNFKGLQNTVPTHITGEPFVSSLMVKNLQTNEESEILTSGIFVEIGMIPSTDFAKNILQLDELGRVVVNPKNQTTSVPGIWSAGDCTDELYHQNNIAAGDAVKALEDLYFWLKART